MKNIFLLITCLVCVSYFLSSTAYAVQASSEPKTGYQYSNIIVFGDSLSDATSLDGKFNDPHGNNFWVKSPGTTGAPISSVNKKRHARVIWPNYLAEQLSITNNNNAFILSPENIHIYPSSQARRQKLSALTTNIDYAWASAETGKDYVNDANWSTVTGYPNYNNAACDKHGPGLIAAKNSCVPGVIIQISQFLKDTHQKPNPKSLVIIWGGGNDVFNNLAKIVDKNKHGNKYILLAKMMNAAYPFAQVGQATLSNPVKNLKIAVTMLIDAGIPAQNIYVINLPDLADTPAALRMAKGSKVVLTSLTMISGVFNSFLRANLVFNYFDSLHNLPNGHIISANGVLKPIIKNPLAFGFTKTLVSCARQKQLPYCRGYLFFNHKHPTSKTHQLIAKYVAVSVD